MKIHKHTVQAALLPMLLFAGQEAQGSAAYDWREGHGDLTVNHIDGAWRFGAKVDGAPKPEYAPGDVALILGDNSRAVIPANPNFAFLGEIGAPIWIAPQNQVIGVPFVGVSSSQTALGLFANNRFDLLLTRLQGPGDFIMWTTGGVGTPTARMNTRDGITGADLFGVPSGGHTHVNWGFTSPGTYSLGFTARGTLSGANQPTASGEATYRFEVGVIKSGEVDIEIALEGEELEFHVHDKASDQELNPAHVALHAGPWAWRTVPDAPAFAFLGQAGANVHVFPQDESQGRLFIGLAAGEVPQGVFVGDVLKIQLAGFSGPGNLFHYELDALGVPRIHFNTADGLGAADAVLLAAGSHTHRNWAFTDPGIYRVTLLASGELVGGGSVVSEPTTFLFEVFGPTFFDRGELDLEIAFEEGALELALLDEAAGKEFSASDAVLVARASATTTVPRDPAYSFLGGPGALVHILPQAETEGLLFLGIAADEIAQGQFVGETLHLELATLDGPGHMALYSTDAVGAPTVYWNSADGLTSFDRYPIAVGSHAHNHWAFSAPGVYRLGLRATGRLVGGNDLVESEVFTLTFQIKAPQRFERGELDFEIAFADGEWKLAFLEEAAEREHPADEVQLVVVPEAVRTVPSDPAFSFLGEPGSTTHVLPQEEDADVLFLGIAGDEIAPGLFVGNSVVLQLLSATGPGHFALYTMDAFGAPLVFLNTRDGISSADRYPVAAGSHTHANWAFSAPGEYRLTFKAAGTLANGGAPTESGPVTLTFHVEEGGPALAASLVNGGDGLRISWAAANGKNYQLQSRTQLGAGDWLDEGAPRAGNGATLSVIVPMTGDAMKVFRLVVAP